MSGRAIRVVFLVFCCVACYTVVYDVLILRMHSWGNPFGDVVGWTEVFLFSAAGAWALLNALGVAYGKKKEAVK